MPYNNNVPLANQSFAATQAPINGNFAFLQTSLQQDHRFNDGSLTEGIHKQCNMPAQGFMGSVPAGSDGAYYVLTGSQPVFYDKTRTWLLNPFQGVLIGTVAVNSTNLATPTLVVAVPASTVGTIIFHRIGSTTLVSSGQYVSDASNAYAFTNRSNINGSSVEAPLELDNAGVLGSLRIGVVAANSTYNSKTYNYKIFYRPV